MDPENKDTTRPMTYGEKAVGITFNPSNDPKVQKMKELYAEIIDLLNDFDPDGKEMTSDQARLLKIAITEAQGAQMWAVKGITFKS